MQEGIQINRSIIHLELLPIFLLQIVNTMARLIQGTRIVTDIINILEIRFQAPGGWGGSKNILWENVNVILNLYDSSV
ncbi:hypothetical protein CsSME_00037387 [Camellia sinensis var. sinensis]